MTWVYVAIGAAVVACGAVLWWRHRRGIAARVESGLASAVRRAAEEKAARNIDTATASAKALADDAVDKANAAVDGGGDDPVGDLIDFSNDRTSRR